MISFGFLMAAICRISSLLNQFSEIRLNSAHIGLHAAIMLINVVLGIILSVLYMPMFDE